MENTGNTDKSIDGINFQEQQIQGTQEIGYLSMFYYFLIIIIDDLDWMFKWLGIINYNNWTMEKECENLKDQLPEQHPELFVGNFLEAIEKCKREFKYLTVYVHSEYHESSPEFVKNVFANQTVIELLNRHAIIYGCNVNLPNGNRLSDKLRVATYPALMIFVPIQFMPNAISNNLNKSVFVGGMFPLIETYNNLDVENVISLVSEVFEKHSSWIEAARIEYLQRQQNRILLEQQDEEYNKSLQIDLEREKKRKEKVEVESRKREEEEEKRREEEEEEEKREEEKKKREEKRKKAILDLKEEPENDGTNDVVEITFRTLESNRVKRRFYKKDRISSLYEFSRTFESTPYRFSIVKSYPRVILKEMNQTIEEADIGKTMLSIEPIFE